MPGRLPTASDLPANVICSIVPPPPPQPPTNVLILLHGIGDTNLPFKAFSEKLKLPETVCISVRAPTPLPFDLGGFHWGDDIVFDDRTGEMDLDTGFSTSTPLIMDELIEKCLVGKCGYKLREIMIYGFGQGGMVALDVAARLEHGEPLPQPSKPLQPSPLTGGSLSMGSTDYRLSSATGDPSKDYNLPKELGCVVSIGGYIPHASPPPKKGKYQTPVLLCKAQNMSSVKSHHVGRLKDLFEDVEVVNWTKTGDSMPASRDEMLPIMQLLARRLRSVQGVPAGSVEIT